MVAALSVIGSVSNGASVEAAGVQREHRGIGGNALRASVLGANDGLVSNLSLVMGVAGAGLAHRSILITGLAGLVAGAFSMAMGEWISVQSSRELYARELEVERRHITEWPQQEHEELAGFYRAKGLSPAAATHVADLLMTDETTALDAMAREELGISPHDLGGSAWVAAGSSFGLFILGAVVPVLPFALVSSGAAVPVSVGASAVALFILGAAIGLLTERGGLRPGARQVLIGLGAAAITYMIGAILGVSVS